MAKLHPTRLGGKREGWRNLALLFLRLERKQFVMKRRGRPVNDSRRDVDFHVRISRDELEKIERICFETEKTKTEVFKKALDMYYKVYLYAD